MVKNASNNRFPRIAPKRRNFGKRNVNLSKNSAQIVEYFLQL